MFKLINRHTKEERFFDTWENLNKANLDIRTWGRPIEVKADIVEPLAILGKVYVNPMLWVKDFVIKSLSDFEGVYVNGSCFSFMKAGK